MCTTDVGGLEISFSQHKLWFSLSLFLGKIIFPGCHCPLNCPPRLQAPGRETEFLEVGLFIDYIPGQDLKTKSQLAVNPRPWEPHLGNLHSAVCGSAGNPSRRRTNGLSAATGSFSRYSTHFMLVRPGLRSAHV